MKVYQLAPDTEHFKFFTLTDKDDSSKRTRTFQGQSLKENWKPLYVALFHGKTKAEKSRSEDFKISCFDKRVLLVDRSFAELLQKQFQDEIEVLPVESDLGEFFFVNVLGTVDAIKTAGLSQEKIMAMARENNFQFDKDAISNRSFFRDSLFKEIFFTENFINKLNGQTLDGAILKHVGNAS